jgi:hypothetical protein
VLAVIPTPDPPTTLTQALPKVLGCSDSQCADSGDSNDSSDSGDSCDSRQLRQCDSERQYVHVVPVTQHTTALDRLHDSCHDCLSDSHATGLRQEYDRTRQLRQFRQPGLKVCPAVTVTLETKLL